MKLWKVTLLFAAAALLSAQSDTALQRAIRKETLEGDLKSAIDQYKKLAQGKDRAVAAKALVHMGRCYEKLGDAESRKAYERVVREFGEQKEAVDAARQRLASADDHAAGSTLRLISKRGAVVGVSPDGRSLLERDPDGTIHLRDKSTGRSRQITKSEFIHPAVSPDGRQIAFVQQYNEHDLRVVNADGSAERVLWTPEKDWGVAFPQWFPDGKRIIVLSFDKTGKRRLVSVAVASGETMPLWEGTGAFSSQLSPDGKSVVFIKRGRKQPVSDQIWLLQLDSKNETLLFEGQSFLNLPRWTPDGAGVVFLSDRREPGKTVDLWLLRVSGGKSLGFPVIAKAGVGQMDKGIANVWPTGPITRDGTYHFHRRTIEGGRTESNGMTQLLMTKFDPAMGKVIGVPSFVSQTGGASRSPSFSSDGRWLAYTWLDPTSEWKLVVKSIESGEERVISTDLRLNGSWVIFYPDGRSLLVNNAEGPSGGPGWYKVDIATGKWEILRKRATTFYEWPNAISPDGSTIYFNRGTRDGKTLLIAWNSGTGQERELLSDGGIFALSPDGKQMAVSCSDGKNLLITVLPAAGGSRREILRMPGYDAADLAWTPDGKTLIFGPFVRDSGNSQKTFYRVPADGGQSQRIGISPSDEPGIQFPRSFGALRVHPSGRELVYTARGESLGKVSPSEDWVLEKFLPKMSK